MRREQSMISEGESEREKNTTVLKENTGELDDNGSGAPLADRRLAQAERVLKDETQR